MSVLIFALCCIAGYFIGTAVINTLRSLGVSL